MPFKKKDRSYKWVAFRVPNATFERVKQLAAWEGRPYTRVIRALFHLGMETYQTLLDGSAGMCLPEGLPGLPGMEAMMEAMGKKLVQQETLKRIARQSAEMVEEQRRERERIS